MNTFSFKKSLAGKTGKTSIKKLSAISITGIRHFLKLTLLLSLSEFLTPVNDIRINYNLHLFLFSMNNAINICHRVIVFFILFPDLCKFFVLLFALLRIKFFASAFIITIYYIFNPQLTQANVAKSERFYRMLPLILSIFFFQFQRLSSLSDLNIARCHPAG